jgi:hypothetical protein
MGLYELFPGYPKPVMAAGNVLANREKFLTDGPRPAD